MDGIKVFSRENRSFVLMGVIWVVLWIVPWGKLLVFDDNLYLIFFVDMIKLGVALGIFILPGALLYLLIKSERDTIFSLWGILSIGFALSISIIAVIGIAGRLLGFSFVLVRAIFAMVGLCEIFLLASVKPDIEQFKIKLAEISHAVVTNTPLVLALILAVGMTFNGYQFFIDDTTYAAYVANWQNSTRLGFANIVHQIDVVEHSRFWLALYPMGQALLSDLSGVPGILLFSNYLELFLVPLAVLTAFWFARALGLSRKAAGVSALVQTIFYTLMIDDSWPVGFWFFQNMAEDKVAAVFLLAPVFIFITLRFLQLPTKNTLALIFLCGIGLMLTHPVVLFLTCSIVGGLGLISVLMKMTSWFYITQLAAILIIMMLPYGLIRFFGQPSQTPISFDAESVSVTFQAERYVNVVSDRFYGLNPDVLKLFNIPPESNFYSVFQTIRLVPFVLALFGFVLALSKIKDGGLYWYVIVCVLLVAFAAIPYTGWILGYFISARMISRVSWFLPLGLSGALVFELFSERIRIKRSKPRTDASSGSSKQINPVAKGILTGLMFMGILLVSVVVPQMPVYFKALDHNKQLVQVGAYIDRNSDVATTVIALDYSDIQMLPSVSAHANLISFREEKDYNPHNYIMSVEEIRQRMAASNIIRSLDSSVSTDKRCALMDDYNVRFVLAGTDNVELFTNLTSTCRINFTVSYKTKDIILLQSR